MFKLIHLCHFFILINHYEYVKKLFLEKGKQIKKEEKNCLFTIRGLVPNRVPDLEIRA